MHITLKKNAYILAMFLYLPMAAWAYDNFDCVGTAPFWKLSITNKAITFTLKTKASLTMPATEPKAAQNMSMEHIRVFRTKTSNKDVTIIIQKQSCTDGSSPDVFPYEGLIITHEDVYHGCCSKKLLLTH